jgi:3-methylcrotonyl-CoA carboxylase alpha subunit
VEHPVTEEITGQDLVEWQLRVASGEPLPKRQEELAIRGHAVEARLYAEDPTTGFLPSTGRLDHFQLEEEGVRIDTGVEEGDRISPFYDPMIAKLIVHADRRGEALAWLAQVLDGVEIWPVKTNAAFLAEAVSHPEFIAGQVDTGFIPRHLDTLVPAAEPDDGIWRLAAAGMAETSFSSGEERGPWGDLPGFRFNAPEDERVAISHRGQTRVIDRGVSGDMAAGSATWADKLVVFYQGQAFGFDWPGSGGGGGGSASDGSLLSPMPGRVLGVDVRQGDTVVAGQKLLTLEAMKMEHSLAAPFDGHVAELNAAEGAQVTEGTLLVRIESAA